MQEQHLTSAACGNSVILCTMAARDREEAHRSSVSHKACGKATDIHIFSPTSPRQEKYHQLKADFFWASRTASRSGTAEARKNSPAASRLISTEEAHLLCIWRNCSRGDSRAFPELLPSEPKRYRVLPSNCIEFTGNCPPLCPPGPARRKKNKRYPPSRTAPLALSTPRASLGFRPQAAGAAVRRP
jgi:hypothetical protein